MRPGHMVAYNSMIGGREIVLRGVIVGFQKDQVVIKRSGTKYPQNPLSYFTKEEMERYFTVASVIFNYEDNDG